MTNKERDEKLTECYNELEQLQKKFDELSHELFTLREPLEKLGSEIHFTAARIFDIKSTIWRCK